MTSTKRHKSTLCGRHHYGLLVVDIVDNPFSILCFHYKCILCIWLQNYCYVYIGLLIQLIAHGMITTASYIFLFIDPYKNSSITILNCVSLYILSDVFEHVTQSILLSCVQLH